MKEDDRVVLMPVPRLAKLRGDLDEAVGALESSIYYLRLQCEGCERISEADGGDPLFKAKEAIEAILVKHGRMQSQSKMIAEGEQNELQNENAGFGAISGSADRMAEG